jgi:hypothetical protein
MIWFEPFGRIITLADAVALARWVRELQGF